MFQDRDNKTVWKQMCMKVTRVHVENGKGEQTPLLITEEAVKKMTCEVQGSRRGRPVTGHTGH